jgi:hypothetical protein
MRKSSLLITTLLTTVLLLAACGGGSGKTTTTMTATETLEEILAQATNIQMVKYECVQIYPDMRGMQTSRVWFKENKMRIERSYQGQVMDNYLMDMITGDVYMWVPPDNISQEMGIAPGEVSDFVCYDNGRWYFTLQSTGYRQ